MFWVVNIRVSAVGVFEVWIGKNVSDHGSGDGSGSCSAVVGSFDRPWVCSLAMSARSFESEKKCSDHGSGAGCGVFSIHGAVGYGVFRPWNGLSRISGACGMLLMLWLSVVRHRSRLWWRGSWLWWAVEKILVWVVWALGVQQLG
ncbi:unnamed protein product [Camellia sinensis]